MASGDRAAPLWANSLGWNDLFLPVLRLDFHYFLWTWILSNPNLVVKQPFKSPNVNNMCYFPPFDMFGCQKLEKHDVFLRRHQHSQNLFTLELTWFMVSPVTPPGVRELWWCWDEGGWTDMWPCSKSLVVGTRWWGEWTHKSGWGGVEGLKK